MTINPAFNDFGDGCVPNFESTDCDRADGLSLSDPNGAFSAALYYIAADLQELAKTAPPSKAAPLSALVRLIRALAET
jgi:hypothetical protein